MINRITALLLFIGLAWGQNSPIDFETGGYGAAWTWTVFENGDNPSLEIVTNANTVYGLYKWYFCRSGISICAAGKGINYFRETS